VTARRAGAPLAGDGQIRLSHLHAAEGPSSLHNFAFIGFIINLNRQNKYMMETDKTYYVNAP
jgi:hypothetical protein